MTAISTQTSVFEQLLRRISPIVKHYRTDLEVDERLIGAHPGEQFLHWARECGTTLQFLFGADHESYPGKGVEVPYLFGTADRDHILRQSSSIAICEQRAGSSRIVHHYDGRQLRQISIQDAIDIAHVHVRRVRYQWAND
jgi:hypothetical protein